MQVLLKSNVNHDGNTYQAGDTLDIDESAAKQLIDLGVAEKAKEVKVANQPKAEEKVEEAKVVAKEPTAEGQTAKPAVETKTKTKGKK